MLISRLEYSILLYLQQHPLANFSSISESLGVSFYTVKKIYRSLVDKNLVSGVAAVISPLALNLEKVTVFFEVYNYKSLATLELLLDSHNYTRYRSRYLCGDQRGLYVNFELPSNCFSYLDELGDKLLNKNIVRSYELFSRKYGEFRTNVAVQYINWETFDWQFDIDSWIQNFDDANYTLKNNLQTLLDPPDLNNPLRINELDLWVMRALSKDAKLTIKELKEIIENESKQIQKQPVIKDISTISRSVKRIEEKFVLEYQLLLNNKLLSLNNQAIFEVRANENLLSALINYIIKHPLPFKSTLNIFKGGFHWYIRSPSEYINAISNFIWSFNPESMKVMYLIPPSRLYYFYPLNYNIHEKKWNDSYEFFFDPIEKYLH